MKNIILLALFCIVLISCGGTSEIESIVKKGVEAMHNNDAASLEKYFGYDEYTIESYRKRMERDDGNLMDKVEIRKSVIQRNSEGEKDSEGYVLADLTYRNGQTVLAEFVLAKYEGKWIIVGEPQTDPNDFENDVTQTDKTPMGRHPIFGDVLNEFEKLDSKYMSTDSVDEILKKYTTEIIGREVPMKHDTSEGVRILKATIIEVGSDIGNRLRFVIDLTPEDANLIRHRYETENTAWRIHNGFFIYYTCHSDDGILYTNPIHCYDGKTLHITIVVPHNRIGMWRNLKYINMISKNDYEHLTNQY